jgi:hypothetical protein
MAKPKLGALISAFTDQVQDLENALYEMILGRALPWATGVTLERIGNMVGRPRPAYGLAATDDRSYRALIYAQIVANTSYGTTEEVYSLMRLIGADQIQIIEPGNYTMVIQYAGDLLLSASDLMDVLVRATGPVELVVTQYDPSGYFGWVDDPASLSWGEGSLSRRIA